MSPTLARQVDLCALVESVHMASVRLGKTSSSALAEHANHFDHNIAWQNSKILASEACWNKRKLTESCLIASENDVLFNKDCGRTVPFSYLPVINKFKN